MLRMWALQTLVHQLILPRLEIPCIRHRHPIAFKHLVDSTRSIVSGPSNVRVVELQLQISLLFLLLFVFRRGRYVRCWNHVFLNVLDVLVQLVGGLPDHSLRRVGEADVAIAIDVLLR